MTASRQPFAGYSAGFGDRAEEWTLGPHRGGGRSIEVCCLSWVLNPRLKCRNRAESSSPRPQCAVLCRVDRTFDRGIVSKRPVSGTDSPSPTVRFTIPTAKPISSRARSRPPIGVEVEGCLAQHQPQHAGDSGGGLAARADAFCERVTPWPTMASLIRVPQVDGAARRAGAPVGVDSCPEGQSSISAVWSAPSPRARGSRCAADGYERG